MADTTTKILEVVVDNNQALSAIADYNKLIDEQKQKQKELADDFKAGKMSQEDYYKAMAKSKEETKAYSRQMQELSKEVQNNIKQEQEHDGSLRGLRAALSNATKEYDALSRAEREGAKGKALQDHINQITTELKEAEAETQRFYRNVGNYPDLKPLKTQLKEAKEQLAQMKLEGKENTEEYQQLLGVASQLQDAMGDVNAAIKTGASDTAQLDTLINGTSTIMSLYAQYSTISRSMGIENEELDKTFQALALTMGALTALQTLQNTLQAQSAVMRGVNAAQTWLQVAAEKAHATAITSTGIAQKAATVAQWAFNAAANANPIGLLVAAVVAAIGAIYGLIKAYEYFTGPSQEALDNFKKTGEELEKLKEQYADYIEEIKAAGAIEEEVLAETIKLNRDMAKRRAEHFAEAKRLYDDDEDEYTAALDAKKAADEAYQESLKVGLNNIRASWASHLEEVAKSHYGNTEFQIQQARRAYEARLQIISEEAQAGRLRVTQVAEMNLQAEIMYNAEVERIRTEAAKTAAKTSAQRAKTERDILRSAMDKELALIANASVREEAIEKERHKRAIEDLNRRLKEEKDLTKAAKEGIQRQIEAEYQAHQQNLDKIDAEARKKELEEAMAQAEKTLQLKLATVKEGSEEEYRLKQEQLAEQLRGELMNDKLTEEQRLLLRKKYNQDLEALEDEHLNNLYQKEMDMMKLEWDNKIAEAALRGENTLALEVERRKAELDALHQMEEESDAEFKARMLAAEQAYTDSKKQLLDQQAANAKANADASAAVMGSLSQLLSAFGEENEEAAKAAKVLALGEIAINTGKAIAAGVAQAQSVPFPANIAAIASTVATVLANVATAITTVKSAKFATGGLVIGPGTGTSDSISARLSNGESVMNARSTAMFGPILSSLNQAGGGVAFNPKGGGQAEGFQYLASAVAAGMKHADLRVGVDEITDVKGRVDRIKDISTIG